MQEEILTIDPNSIETSELYGYLTGAVAPRPIAFASTVDAQGRPNLSPFSFFNVFSANPPMLVFSPVRKTRDGSTKHTLQNVEATREVVINIVNYAIVQQMSLTSTEYAEGVDEFVKAGLTKEPSIRVKPFRVKEAPVQIECKVTDIIACGDQGGAGNLVLCEVVKIHMHKAILDGEGNIDQHKIDLVSRMGGNWYSRSNMGLFEVPKPLRKLGIGVDSMPESVQLSSVLTGNDLGKLGNVERLPEEGEIKTLMRDRADLRMLVSARDINRIHRRAQEFLHDENPEDAWKLLLAQQ